MNNSHKIQNYNGILHHMSYIYYNIDRYTIQENKDHILHMHYYIYVLNKQYYNYNVVDKYFQTNIRKHNVLHYKNN